MSLSLVGVSPSLSVGGEVFTDLVNLKKLITGTGASSNTKGTFREYNGTSGFLVPANFKLVIKAVKINTRTAVVAGPVFLYSDNDLGVGSTTAPTNPVYFAGSTNAGNSTIAAAGYLLEFGGLNFEVPAGKYFGVDDQDASSSLTVQAFGYLVAV